MMKLSLALFTEYSLAPDTSNIHALIFSPYKKGGCLTRHLVDPGLSTSPNINAFPRNRFISVYIVYTELKIKSINFISLGAIFLNITLDTNYFKAT